jgi:transposase
VANQPRGWEIHVIADNLSAHKTKRVEEFLGTHRNVQLHFTPTYSSRLNQVELWFAKIERDVIVPRHIHLGAGLEEETHALHTPLQSTTQTREVEALRSNTTHYSRINCYGPLDSLGGREPARPVSPYNPYTDSKRLEQQQQTLR